MRDCIRWFKCKLKPPKKLLLPRVKKSIYYTHFYSHLKYGIYVWGHKASKAQLSKLQKIPHECTKLITSTNSIDSCTYKQLGILQVKQIICLETTKLMFKSLKGDLLKMLTEAITMDQNRQSLNKSHTYPTHNKHYLKSIAVLLNPIETAFSVTVSKTTHL